METSPNFNAEVTRNQKGARFVIGVAEYVESQPDYVQGSLEEYERVFDTPQECIDRYQAEK